MDKMWYGKDVFGECDRVPGLLYVGTLFHHIGFFPLMPVRSMVILEGTEQVVADGLEHFSYTFAWREIPLNRKSICLGYVRALAWVAVMVGGVVSAFMLLVTLVAGHGWQRLLPWLAALMVGAAIVWLTHRLFANAARDRALELAKAAQVPENAIEAIRDGRELKTELHIEAE